MAYSTPLMIVIFIKPPRGGVGRPNSLAALKSRSGAAVRWTDVQRFNFRRRLSEATHPANTCVSTPSLCNANFARS
jgi:hypothetical protein